MAPPYFHHRITYVLVTILFLLSSSLSFFDSDLKFDTPVSPAFADFRWLFAVLRNETETRRILGCDDYRSSKALHRNYFLKRGVTLDDDGSITMICWDSMHIKSEINWDAVRRLDELKVLELSNNELSGPVIIPQLPNRVELVALNNNMFSGSIDLGNLPRRLRILSLRSNYLSGYLNISELSRSLQVLHLDENHLYGQFSLIKVPPSKCRVILDWKWFKILDGNKRRTHRLLKPTPYYNASKSEHTFEERLGHLLEYKDTNRWFQ